MTATQTIPQEFRKTSRGKRLNKLFPVHALQFAEMALQAYYRAVDSGATRQETNAIAERVYQSVGPLLLAIARRLVPRRTGLRGARSWHVIENVQESVLVSLLTRVRAGSPKGRFNPTKRDLVVFAWVLVDRAVISSYCRRKLPCSFTQVDFRDGLVACHRHPAVLDELAFREKLAETRVAVSRLQEPTREVVQRVCLEGEGKKQVALSLGRSPAFVTRELARGISVLSRLLSGSRENLGSFGPYEPTEGKAARQDYWVDA